MSRTRALLASPILGVLLLAAPPSARGDLTLPTGFRDSTIYSAFGLPVAMAFLPGPIERGPRILVLEQKAPRVLLLVNGVLAPPPPINQITNVDWASGERGALSLAVDPRWPAQPYVYTHYTSFGTSHLARYRVSGDLAFAGNGIVSLDASTKMLLLDDIPDANTNHNGGCLRFGPDGMLYLSTGDDELSCIAQDTTSLGGKVLRMDVTALPDTGHGPVPHALLTPADNPHVTSPDEHYRLVHALGMRNPFRMHFDPVDGALWIADVGQSVYEEINRITGPANLGWPWYENTTRYPMSCGPEIPPGLTYPVATLVNPPNRSVISLSPYRAPAGASEPFPAAYEGDYFFADYYSGVVRRIGFDGSAWVPKPAPGQPNAQDWATGAKEIVDGAVGPDGALWYLIQGVNFAFNNGAVHRVAWRQPPDTVTGVPRSAPVGLELSLPRPNPARGEAEIPWRLAEPGAVELTIHDVTGRRIATLETGTREPGPRRSRWNGREESGRMSPPGVYLVRLRVGGATLCRRIALVR